MLLAVVSGPSGGSTNASLHRPAIAHEFGLSSISRLVRSLQKDTYIADLKTRGR